MRYSESDYSREPNTTFLWVKRGIWIYFWLLIFEGTLRKWIVPQLSTPLLLIRDPALIFIYWMVSRSGGIKSAKLGAVGLLSIGIITLACIQIALGKTTLVIALYGVQSYLLHLPLILIIAERFTFEDAKRMGRWVLLLSIPMALLMMAQYSAPSNSWINAGAGEGSRQIRSSGDHVRAAGTFSFATGIICFFPLAQAFLLYGLARPKTYSKWILILSALAVIFALPLSGSRTLLFVTIGSAGFALFAGFRSMRSFARLAQVAVALSVTCVIALQVPVFHEAISTFEDRWREASAVEGNVKDVLSLRVLGVIADGFDSAQTVTWLGEGIGMGSNVAAYLETGSPKFLLAEMEWPRVVLEFGPILGLSFMIFRVLICWDLFQSAFRALKRDSVLSWLLVPATIPFLIINSMEQSTNLGFIVLSAGLCFAATKPPTQLARTQKRPSRVPQPYGAGEVCGVRPIGS